jgi:hypothetical protein
LLQRGLEQPTADRRRVRLSTIRTSGNGLEAGAYIFNAVHIAGLLDRNFFSYPVSLPFGRFISQRTAVQGAIHGLRGSVAERIIAIPQRR